MFSGPLVALLMQITSVIIKSAYNDESVADYPENDYRISSNNRSQSSEYNYFFTPGITIIS